jgi:hypothetical protein
MAFVDFSQMTVFGKRRRNPALTVAVNLLRSSA